MRRKTKTLSPLQLSLLHLFPSLLLLALVMMGFLSLSYSDKKRAVLGAQTVFPQVITRTVQDRINELKQARATIGSEAIESAVTDLEP